MSKHCVYCLAVFLSVIFLSCDDEERDVQKPSLDFEILKNGVVIDPAAPVRGTISFKVTAHDNQKTSLIKVYFDDQIVLEQTNSDLLDAEFDTRTITDGVHSIKIVASDTEENASESFLNVEVDNILYAHTVPKFLTGNRWLVLSDNKGHMHDYKNVTQGGLFVFYYPENYANEIFDISVVIVYKQPVSFFVSTFKEVPPGDYEVPEYVSPPSAGKYSVNLDESLQYSEIICDSRNGIYSSNAGHPRQHDLFLSQSTGDLFVSVQESVTGEERYFYNPSISIGESTTITPAVFSGMKLMTQQNIPTDASWGIALVGGIPVSGGKNLICSFSYFETQEMQLHYPIELLGTAFTKFRTMVNTYKNFDGFTIYDGYQKGTPGMVSEIETLPIEITAVNKKEYPQLQVTASGDADYVAYRMISPGNEPISWGIFAPFSASMDIRLPAFSEEFISAASLTADFTKLRLDYINFHEYGVINEYDQMIRYVIEGLPEEVNDDWLIKGYSWPEPSTGGRASAQPALKSEEWVKLLQTRSVIDEQRHP